MIRRPALLLLLLLGCRGFEKGQTERLAAESPKEVHYEQAEERPAGAGESLGQELARDQTSRAYTAAGRARLAGDLHEARRQLQHALRIDPKFAKARRTLAEVEQELARRGELDRMTAEEQVAREKAQVEIRRRMKLAAELLGHRDFRRADEEYQLALRSTLQLPHDLPRAALRYRLHALRDFTHRFAAEAGRPIER